MSWASLLTALWRDSNENCLTQFRLSNNYDALAREKGIKISIFSKLQLPLGLSFEDPLGRFASHSFVWRSEATNATFHPVTGMPCHWDSQLNLSICICLVVVTSFRDAIALRRLHDATRSL
jgi:hypothetical protein